MSELRWNALLGEWVMTATHRQDRTFRPSRDYCPLCPTLPGGPVTEVPADDYDIVVFENRFPSLRLPPPDPAVTGTRLSPVRPGEGVCEVVLYTPRHDATLTDASLDRIRRLVCVWGDRTRELGALPQVEYVLVFENRGEAIGVTLHHPHGQIYAYPMIPPVIARELEQFAARRSAGGGCLACDLLAEELVDRRRLVAEDDSWVATVPFASRWPYEVHLVPRRHLGLLTDLDEAERDGLARLLKTVLLKYDRLFGFPLPYVMAVHQRPVRASMDGYHLHVEFYPPNRTESKRKDLAGTELGAGVFVNDTLPEHTALRLRRLEPLDPKELPG